MQVMLMNVKKSSNRTKIMIENIFKHNNCLHLLERMKASEKTGKKSFKKKNMFPRICNFIMQMLT